ncbi:MAG: FAD-dependent oxidoreductase [Flavobacteriales bacterium]|jgi:glycine/D-amino acid oxidase-like deaminating enzyme|nr:FAD-dependent oxidoreductase [Flavobacteriales bacterium]
MKLRSNEPFGLLRNGLLFAYPSLQHDIEADVVVIGAGITGSLIAHRCVAEGHATVVIDRREVGHGSTAATTSMLQYEIDVPLHALIAKVGEKDAVAAYHACGRAIDTLEELDRLVKGEAGFRRKRSLYFAAWKKDVAGLRLEYEARQRHGFAVRWLTAERIAERYGIHGTHGGILSRQGASVDAFRLTHRLLQHGVRRGLQVFDRTAIAQVRHRRNGTTITTEDGHVVRCRHVVHCTGFESVELLGRDHVDLHSTYAIVSEAMPDHARRLKDTLVWNTADPYLYMRTTADGRLIVGGADEEFVDAERRDRLLARKAGRLERQVQKRMPDVPFRTDFAWAGTFGATRDGLPCIGRHPEVPGAIFVLGFGGNGICFSVVGMDMVAAFLAGREHPLAHAFRFGR